MKFSISREALLDPLQLVSGVVERKQTLAILSNLLMEVEDGVLTMTGTDQEVELSVKVAEIQSATSGEITVPARKLVDICRSLTGKADITLALEENRLGVSSGRFRSHLATQPSIDFPNAEMESAEVKLEIEAALLLSLLGKTSFAMAQQDVRYFFNGVLIELSAEGIRLVATNGQRLATSIGRLPEESPTAQFIVPRKGVNELMRLLNDAGDTTASLTFSANHMRVEVANAVLTTKLIDGTYPDYTRAIPTENDKMLKGNRLEIREALQRTSILSNEKYRNVRLSMGQQKLDIHANNPLQEEAEESVAVEYDGELLEIGFNVGYLLDALSTMSGEQVSVAFSNANSACVLTDPQDADTLYVVSPMML